MKSHLKNLPLFLSNSLFLIALLTIALNACKQTAPGTNDLIYRKVAWNTLSANTKSKIKGDWQKAAVIKRPYNDEQVAAISFDMDNGQKRGLLVVYVSLIDQEAVGISPQF